jgi:cysteine desulfurase
MNSKQSGIYLDYASTTFLHPSAQKAMLPFLNKHFANPSGLHKPALTAHRALNRAREQVGKILTCKNEELVFTAGGTESINLAIFGIARQFFLKNRQTGHLITTTIEHSAVLNSFKALKEEGWQTTYLRVNKQGLIDIETLKNMIKPNTVLISIMYANNEIGTIQPISAIGKLVEQINAKRLSTGLGKIYFHTDACQAGGVLDLNVNKLKVDLMTINGSKIYGPKQTGVLYVKSKTPLRPLIFGGGQENNLRSGTENVPGIIGFATALNLAHKTRLKENQRLRTLRNYFVKQITQLIPDSRLNGPPIDTDSENTPTRLPNNINFSFKNTDGESLLLYLDAQGIAVSTGSACHTSSSEASHVLTAIHCPLDYIFGTIRFSLGTNTNKKDLDYTLTTLKKIISTL